MPTKSLPSKKVISWAFYDFADQAFQAIFITLLFPIFIVQILGGNELQVGIVSSLSVLAAAFLVPWIWATADIIWKRNYILLTAWVFTWIFWIITGFVDLYLALLFWLLAKIFHYISKGIYDSKIIETTQPQNFWKVSGIGLLFGYIWTIASLLVAFFILEFWWWESLEGFRYVFVMCALWYIIFMLPILLNLPDRSWVNKKLSPDTLKQSLKNVIKNIKNLPKTNYLGRFLGAAFLYNNAMSSIVIFLWLYATEDMGMEMKEFFPIFGLLSIFAAIGAIIFGRLSDKYWPFKMIKLCLIIWIGVVSIMITDINYYTFLLTSCVWGIVFGGIWALNRHTITYITPPNQISSIFGFESLTARMSGLFGPAIFGALANFYSYEMAMISVIVFFILGFFVIRKLH